MNFVVVCRRAHLHTRFFAALGFEPRENFTKWGGEFDFQVIRFGCKKTNVINRIKLILIERRILVIFFGLIFVILATSPDILSRIHTLLPNKKATIVQLPKFYKYQNIKKSQNSETWILANGPVRISAYNIPRKNC